MALHHLLTLAFYLLLICSSILCEAAFNADMLRTGDRVAVTTSSFHAGSNLPLHDLPLCQSLNLQPVFPRSILQLFESKPMYTSLHEFKVLKNTTCKLLCVVPRTSTQGIPSKKMLTLLMMDDPRDVALDMEVDGRRVTFKDSFGNKYLPGYSLGFRDADDFYINNHISFFLEYDVFDTTRGPLYRIVDAFAQASSRATSPHAISDCEKQTLSQRYSGDVIFTYSVHWIAASRKGGHFLAKSTPLAEHLHLRTFGIIVVAVVLSILILYSRMHFAHEPHGEPGGQRSEYPRDRLPSAGSLSVLVSGSLQTAVMVTLVLGRYWQQSPWAFVPLIATTVGGFFSGAALAAFCLLLHEPVTSSLLSALSLMPTAIGYGLLGSMEVYLETHSLEKPFPFSTILSRIATSSAIASFFVFLGAQLVMCLLHYKGFLIQHKAHRLNPDNSQRNFPWIMCSIWQCLCSSVEVCAFCYWSRRFSQVEVLFLLASFHALSVSQLIVTLSASRRFSSLESRLWQAQKLSLLSGLFSWTSLFLVFGQSALSKGLSVFMSFLCATLLLSLVTTLISGAVGALTASCIGWNHSRG